MAARSGGCLKPFISTDINWCYAFFRGGAQVVQTSSKLARVWAWGKERVL